MLSRTTRSESPPWAVVKYDWQRGGVRARRAWARLIAARDAFELASRPDEVDRALERLQAAELAYWQALTGEGGR